MSTKKTNSVAYLYKEMDPSEKVEFERLLKENENLLIEVESLRSVSNRLDQLPTISAPDHLLESVYETASNQAASSKKSIYKPLYLAAAAVLALGFTAGALVLDSGEQTSVSGTASVGSIGAFSPEIQPRELQGRQSGQNSTWIDRNEVLHFTGSSGITTSSDRDSLLQNSYQRLTPVNDPVQNRAYQRNLHLTGSRP
jgi:hypothetical protein